MGTSSWLATWLDWHFLEIAQQVPIAQQLSPGIGTPPVRPGAEIARELGGRKLLRYLRSDQLGAFRDGSTDITYVTPTPYTPEETARWLVLPSAHVPRTHVLILDPDRIPYVQGPLWVAAGRGIQYILPAGFPPEAILVPGAPGQQWEVEVT
jgi:hypothetical protein